MQRVRVIHWRPAEAGPLIEQIQAAGFQADYDHDVQGSALARAIRENPPVAVLIDLSRRPGYCRDIAVWLRGNKSTRTLPLVFVNGEAEKVGQIKEILPDATYTTTARLRKTLKSACRKPTLDPVVPPAMMDRYKGRSAVQKLGIAPGAGVGLIDAPRDYLSVLGELPENVELAEDPETVQGVTLWFVHDPEALLAALRRMYTIAARTKLWIVWRKGSTNGVTQYSVREAALEAGLVDYKICSVDARWSAMLFARRKN